MDINGDNVNLINTSVQKILLIIKTISSLILSLAVVIIIWMIAIIFITRPDMILCSNGDYCEQMNETMWKCLTNQSKFYLNSQLVNLIFMSKHRQKSCFMSYQLVESIYDCQPKIVCSYKMVVLLNEAFIELGASWFMLSSLTTYFRPNQFDLRRAKEALGLNKFISAFLILMSTSLYRIHSVVPLAVPLANICQLFNLGSNASLISILIVILKFIYFILTIILQNYFKCC